MNCNESITLTQGKTYRKIIRWETSPILYRAISAITQGAPVSITSVDHDIPDGWRVAVVSVKGMKDINAAHSPPKDSDYHAATVINSNTVELNDVNSSDFKTYQNGGYLQFNSPVDLTGYVARMAIKDKSGGTLLTTLTDGAGILIDNNAKTITILFTAIQTADYTWSRGVYELELESPDGDVTALLAGQIIINKEITD